MFSFGAVPDLNEPGRCKCEEKVIAEGADITNRRGGDVVLECGAGVRNFPFRLQSQKSRRARRAYLARGCVHVAHVHALLHLMLRDDSCGPVRLYEVLQGCRESCIPSESPSHGPALESSGSSLRHSCES
jgi:hypothetical protein